MGCFRRTAPGCRSLDVSDLQALWGEASTVIKRVDTCSNVGYSEQVGQSRGIAGQDVLKGGEDRDALNLRGSGPNGGADRVIVLTEDEDIGDRDGSNDGGLSDAPGKQSETVRFENIEKDHPRLHSRHADRDAAGWNPGRGPAGGRPRHHRDNGIQNIRWIGESACDAST